MAAFFNRRRSLMVHLSTIITLLVIGVGGALGTAAYLNSARLLEEAARSQLLAGGTTISARLLAAYKPAELAVEMLSRDPLMEARTLGERVERRRMLVRMIRREPTIRAAFVGYPDGSFVLMRKLDRESDQELFQPPQGAAYLMQAITRGEDGPPEGTYFFYSKELHEVGRVDKPDYLEYDPRLRPWFLSAQRNGVQIKTPPYIFYSTGEVGTTLARVNGSHAVAGIDITLQALSGWLAALKLTPNTQIALVDTDGKLIAHADHNTVVRLSKRGRGRLIRATLDEPEYAPLRALIGTAPPRSFSTGITAFEQAGVAYQGMVMSLPVDGARPYTLAIAVPEFELFAAARDGAVQTAIVLGLILVVAIPLGTLVARQVARPLLALAAEARDVRNFDFTPSRLPVTHIIEVDRLAADMDSMRDTLRRFSQISALITSEADFDSLMRQILEQTAQTVGAIHGVLYLISDDGLSLTPTVVTGEGSLMPAPFALDAPPAPYCSALTLHRARTECITPEDWLAIGCNPDGLHDDLRPAVVVVPLSDRDGALVGLLVLVQPTERDGALVRFVEALSGTSAVTLETRRLIADQKRLFEAFIAVLAGAVDAKSPHTGGHCARVPELTQMIAQAACDATKGPFAAFSLSEKDWEAVQIASWLHDCGKVTTPEFVIDKATKLEALYDRIHEVRTRFEVLKRDAWIAYWRARAEDPSADEVALAATRDAALAALDDDFAFVAQCNTGGEFLAPEAIARLRAIGARTWTRTLDDRLGLGHDELERKSVVPAPALPAEEPLLADKPEHRLPRRESDFFSLTNPWGIHMDIPELLYDRGELANLCVSRGTLTPEERYKINEHMVQTVIMLSKLPFPRHLRAVPEIAGGHHEKMDGTGYPRRLRGDEMSPVARMMAIADVFEALTAIDRPYKKGKTLTETLRIMSVMVKDRHLDPEIFTLFLRAGVYRTYADRFMRPEQIDDVRIEDYLPAEAEPARRKAPREEIGA